ncbi:MAG: four helix bundle protein [Bacteroidales bacterium]|jgi:four helix bundle protein|nr:four helix bundle protein [Bacteroidales bacterium]MDD4001771.1 four helix bundle protein [Bacteroidales bacterium]MDD4528834.1 four helix bundle protein [Bacteroidales bacterium]MDD4829026.1 four helix bundle protein [Bacteroidales bacterium]
MENQNKPVSFFRFEDLRIYHKSLDYFNWIIEQSKTINPHEQKIVIDSLTKAAMGVSVNIAEGSSRHKLQFVTFLKDAKTAVRECVVLSSMALGCGAFTIEQYEHSKEILVEMTKMLGAMIVSLQKSSPRDSSEPKIDFNSSTEIDFEY